MLWEPAAARVNHFLWKVCGRGERGAGRGRSGERGAASCPRPGPAEPPRAAALRRRRRDAGILPPPGR